MKEQHYFYTPEPQSMQLPPDEAAHAVRVLRLQTGDEIFLMDGRGTFYRASIAETTKKSCTYRIDDTMPQVPAWNGHLHLAMGPTKNLDRTEWLAEKATEVGIDELTFLDCRWSERHIVKPERIERILVAAMKQSRKAWLPQLNAMTPFLAFINRKFDGQKFICHCHEDNLPLLRNQLRPDTDAVVMIGPEGDFSPEEVEAAEAAGFISVSLGRSRLRTETAALVAAVMMQNR
jgi:16S rRNA (uracil1498-N3)-methyltransferase